MSMFLLWAHPGIDFFARRLPVSTDGLASVCVLRVVADFG